MSRRKSNIPAWKSKTGFGDPFTRMFLSQVMSRAFISLNYTSKVLYMYMSLSSMDKKTFEYPYPTAIKVLKNGKTIKYCLLELELKGFIDVTRASRKGVKNKYTFSEGWKDITEEELAQVDKLLRELRSDEFSNFNKSTS